MADTIQLQLERMIPELEDLQQRGIFSKDEIQQIIQRRKNFEYTMKRTPLNKIDCLRYIEYELNLDALRRQRKKRLEIFKHSLSDASGIQRIHFIFNRMLRKFYGDVELWIQYIDFCKKAQSGKILSQVFARALQMHPYNVGFWIESANWEFEACGNWDSARILMQRALRLNGKSKRLWTEYFRLECLILYKLHARREILGLDIKNEKIKQNAPTISLSELKEEKDMEKKTLTTEEQSRELVLKGKIVEIVYKNALQEFPSCFEFRHGLLKICDELSMSLKEEKLESFHAFLKTQIQCISDSFEKDLKKFSDEEQIQIWKVLCERPLKNWTLTPSQKRQACIELYEGTWKKTCSWGVLDQYLTWFLSEIGQRSNDENPLVCQYLVGQLYQMMDTLAKDIFTFNPQTKLEKKIWESLFKGCMDVHLRKGTSMLQMIQLLEKARGHHSFFDLYAIFFHCSNLFLKKIIWDESSKEPTVENHKEVKNMLKKQSDWIEFGFKYEKKNQFDLYQLILTLYQQQMDQWKISRDASIALSMGFPSPKTSFKRLEALYQRALKEVENQENPKLVLELRCKYLHFLLENYGIQAVREWIQTLFRTRPMLKIPETKEFYQFCIQLEKIQDSNGVCSQWVVELYEKLCNEFGAEDVQVWKAYGRYVNSYGNVTLGNQIQWKAMKHFPSIQ